MSMFTTATNKLHSSLIETGGSTLASNLLTGAVSGAVLDGGIGIYNGGGFTSSVAKGAIKGSVMHGAYKGLGNQYTKGVASAISHGVGNMTQDVTKAVRSNFSISNFTKTTNSGLDDVGALGQIDLKSIAFQSYNKVAQNTVP